MSNEYEAAASSVTDVEQTARSRCDCSSESSQHLLRRFHSQACAARRLGPPIPVSGLVGSTIGRLVGTISGGLPEASAGALLGAILGILFGLIWAWLLTECNLGRPTTLKRTVAVGQEWSASGAETRAWYGRPARPRRQRSPCGTPSTSTPSSNGYDKTVTTSTMTTPCESRHTCVNTSTCTAVVAVAVVY